MRALPRQMPSQTGMRIDADRPRPAASSSRVSNATSSGFVRDEAESESTFVPRRLEVAFGSDEPLRSSSAGYAR